MVVLVVGNWRTWNFFHLRFRLYCLTYGEFMVPLNAAANQLASRGPGTNSLVSAWSPKGQDRQQLTLRVPGYTGQVLHMQEAPAQDQDSLYVEQDDTFATNSSACSVAQQHNIPLSHFHSSRKVRT